MLIDLRIHKKLYHSRLSDVFAADGRIYKLFKRSADPECHERAAESFEKQCSAYRRAMKHPILRRHVAEFLGTCNVEQVIDDEGNDISDGYRLDACYAIEELSGPEEKVTAPIITSQYPHVAKMRTLFAEHGISSTGDSSVFSYDDPDDFKLIDFG
jgi:hypothetical protein